MQAVEEAPHAIVDLARAAVEHDHAVRVTAGQEALEALGNKRERRGIGVVIRGEQVSMLLPAGERTQDRDKARQWRGS